MPPEIVFISSYKFKLSDSSKCKPSIENEVTSSLNTLEYDRTMCKLI